jgi:hypothetical protein
VRSAAIETEIFCRITGSDVTGSRRRTSASMLLGGLCVEWLVSGGFIVLGQGAKKASKSFDGGSVFCLYSTSLIVFSGMLGTQSISIA